VRKAHHGGPLSPPPGGGRSSREARRVGVRARAARCDSLRRRAPHPASLRAATLPLQGRVKAISFSRRDPRRSLINGEVRNGKPSPLSTTRHLLFSSLSKRGGRTPTDAEPTTALAHGARSAERARLSAFHHGSRLRDYSSRRLGFRPGFLGLGLNGRYPPSPVPVQGCTSHPGHHAGRLIPKPPGSGLQIRPRAPHPLHLTACLR
jgi:hypothetical protein